MDVKVGPVLTYLSCAVCVMIFFKAAGMTEPHTWESLSSIGYFPAVSIWGGKYWGLWTSVFAHVSFWHLAFNLYWLWLFGSAIEMNAGRFLWIALFLLSGGVSSSAQLAVSGETGLGASGVAYAFFGFVWTTRRAIPAFQSVATGRTAAVFLGWLALGFPLNYFDILPIGNAAHVAGLAVGLLAGLSLHAARWRTPYRLALAGLCLAGFVPAFWAPWSSSWMSVQAIQAHSDRQYIKAVEWYTAILEAEPKNAWALYNRGVLFGELGMDAEAKRDIGFAVHLDPNFEPAIE